MEIYKDFEIAEDKVLCGYNGSAEEVIIPFGVRKIRCGSLINVQSVTIPASVVEIDAGVFGDPIRDITIQSDHLLLPSKKLSIFAGGSINLKDLRIYAPYLSLVTLSEHGLSLPAMRCFMEGYERYSDSSIIEEYYRHFRRIQKRMMPLVFETDCVYLIQRLYEDKKISVSNIEENYMIPARNSGADKIIKYLTDHYPVYGTRTFAMLSRKEKETAIRTYLWELSEDYSVRNKGNGFYVKYIRSHRYTYVKKIEYYDNLWRLMIEEKMLTSKHVDYLLNKSSIQRDAGRVADLLEYKNKHFPINGGDEFSLSDDDPDMKRILRMEERKNKIADQKGIKGIVFVATGEMQNFGDIDYYTDAKDWSDLKAFIEERGGILRSAVSSKTDYLICNDPECGTVKSRKAKELGVTIIDEDTFLKMASSS